MPRRWQTSPDYLLLTDADIEYPPDAVTRLVARAKASRTVLTSLMVKLNCESLAERALIPAFVFFFQMLYPFAWVNRRDAKTAAAAGGCMLVDRRALARAGGIAKIRSALIDDCALARLLKAEGPIWLGLSGDVLSLRTYPRFGDIRRMVARSAYAELDYSPSCFSRTALRHGFDLSRGADSRHFCAVSGQCCRSAGLGLDDANLFADPAFLSRIGAVGRSLSA